MSFRPPRRLGIVLGLLLEALSLGAAAAGMALLVSSPITPGGLLLGLLPAAGLAAAGAVAYRAAGLWNAGYAVDRNGFRLQWGWAAEELPWSAVTGVRPLAEVAPGLRPRPGLWWPGCIVGSVRTPDRGEFDFFASETGPRSLVLSTPHRNLVISPQDPVAFLDAYVQSTRQGVLAVRAEKSVRPDFLAARVWADASARWVLTAGLLVPVALVAYLAVRSPALPAAIPFGFDAFGQPNPAAPQGRLLLLPLFGLGFWVLNLIAGAWIYRRSEDRPISYAVWSTAVLAGGLIWGATLHMLSAAAG